MLDPLISADLLKLRRRRGLFAFAALAPLGAAAIYVASQLAEGDRVGGLASWWDLLGVLDMVGVVVGVLVGATAGAQDAEAGTHRDLLATGTPRLRLYRARLAAALLVVVPAVLVGAAASAAVVLLAPAPDAAPSAGQVAAGFASVLAAGTFGAAACVGLAALVPSRGPVIGIALAFQLGVSPLLGQAISSDALRAVIPHVAITRLVDSPQLAERLSMATALVVLSAWLVALVGAGAWRTTHEEV